MVQVNNLPTLDSAVFLGREEALAALEALPAAGAGVVAQSVRGLGGVGKSTLVLHHARRFLAAGGGPVWWVDAESASKVMGGLAALATALNPVHAALPLEDAAQWAMVWLQGRTGWLLVLDNAEDPADLDPYLGRLTTGQVVITTRRDLPGATWAPHCGWTRSPPRRRWASCREITGSTETTGLASLTEELGYLPLALQQAGAYLTPTRTSPIDYLAELQQDPAGVLAAATPGDPQQRTIAQLWSVTLSAVPTRRPARGAPAAHPRVLRPGPTPSRRAGHGAGDSACRRPRPGRAGRLQHDHPHRDHRHRPPPRPDRRPRHHTPHHPNSPAPGHPPTTAPPPYIHAAPPQLHRPDTSERGEAAWQPWRCPELACVADAPAPCPSRSQPWRDQQQPS